MSKGTEFRLQLRELRKAYGVRCENCRFFVKEGRMMTRCTLEWEWTAPDDWCNSWEEPE